MATDDGHPNHYPHDTTSSSYSLSRGGNGGSASQIPSPPNGSIGGGGSCSNGSRGDDERRRGWARVGSTAAERCLTRMGLLRLADGGSSGGGARPGRGRGGGGGGGGRGGVWSRGMFTVPMDRLICAPIANSLPRWKSHRLNRTSPTPHIANTTHR